MRDELQVVEAPQVPGGDHAKLLLVDDNGEDLLYYTAILQHLGYAVRPCMSFTEAASLFARDAFDLVIVGQGGTSFEGRTVLARAIEADRNTPVLILTHNPTMDCYVEAMQLGAFDYLQKPLAPSEVADLVTHHLRITQTVRGMARARGRKETVLPVPVH
ncbi:MAG: response regulator [Deltaproteobacteria bacterium]